MSDSVWLHRWQPTRLRCPWDSSGKNTGVGCHFLLQCMKVKNESEVAQSCPTLCDPMDCSPPGSSVHGIFQARVLEWGAIGFSVQQLSQGRNRFSLITVNYHTHDVVQSLSCVRLCDPVDYSMPGFPVHHQLLELAQTQVHWICVAIQPSHPLLPTSAASVYPSIRVFSSKLALCIR